MKLKLPQQKTSTKKSKNSTPPKLNLKLPKTKKDKYDPRLYGKDPEENIVAVEQVDGEPMVEIFSRKNGTLVHRFEKSKAYFYTNHAEAAIDNMWDDGTEIFELEGDLHYDTLIETNNKKTAYWFRKNADRGNFYMVRPRGQYLLASGKTLFKGMDFDDVKRMYFDLETYTTKGYKFSNATRLGDKITLLPIKLNQGRDNKFILVNDEDGWGDELYDHTGNDGITNKEALEEKHPDVNFVFCENEKMLIEAFFIIIEKTDPDAFINHNIFNFDLEFLFERCRLHDIRMNMSRDGSRPNRYETVVYISDKTREIVNYEFYGRHVIDTEIMARQIDATRRNFENYQLKSLIKALGKERKGRVIVPGARIASAWDGSDPEFSRMDLISYALDDVEDAQTLDQLMGGAIFESTKFTPYPFQDVFRLASGGKSETLFVRYYYDHAHSLPHPQKKRDFGGGYADVLQFGLVLKNCVLGDIKSLYPSLGINEDIQPVNDVLGFYQQIIRLFRDFRYNIKDAIAEAPDEDTKVKLKSTDGAIKIYLNTIAYGYIASQTALFNDYAEATRITEAGQKVLKKMLKYIEANGGIPLKCDTDGVVFIPPEEYTGDEEIETEFVNIMSDAMPEGIEVGVDGRYKSVLTIDGKSYALKDHNDKITIKGDTLKSRSKENFILEHLEECVNRLLDGDTDVLEESMTRWVEKIEKAELTRDEVLQYSEVKEPLNTYRTKVELGSGNGGRNADAAYEIACQLEDAGQEVHVGDRIEYYVAESPNTIVLDGRTNKPRIKPKYKRVCDLAKNIDQFKPGTTNTKHYLKRIRDSSEPIYMLFYPLQILKGKFGFSMHKKRREKLAEIQDYIYNDPLEKLEDDEDQCPF